MYFCEETSSHPEDLFVLISCLFQSIMWYSIYLLDYEWWIARISISISDVYRVDNIVVDINVTHTHTHTSARTYANIYSKMFFPENMVCRTQRLPFYMLYLQTLESLLK